MSKLITPIAGELDAEQYLGDGVYVGHDGWQIWLRTERERGWHEIALEPHVLAAFHHYMNELRRRTKEAREGATANDGAAK